MSIAHVMSRAGIEHTRDDAARPVAAIERLKPFPEVTEPHRAT